MIGGHSSETVKGIYVISGPCTESMRQELRKESVDLAYQVRYTKNVGLYNQWTLHRKYATRAT